MRNDELDAIDRVLDDALSQYAGHEPLAGLEQRVLNRIGAAGMRSRHKLWPWWLAGCAVAAGVASLAVIWMMPVAGPALVKLPAPTGMPRLASAQPLRKRSTPPGLPKRRVFPTPAPVSKEERVLLALLSRAPDETREAIRDLQKRSTEPIGLEDIKIEPLPSDGLR